MDVARNVSMDVARYVSMDVARYVSILPEKTLVGQI